MASAFLDERHLTLRHEAQRFCVNEDLEHSEDGPTLVARLAGAGLLRACVPAQFGGLRERVEVRDLVVLRSVLGWRSSLLDTMFAMQGLGSYAVTLAGSAAQQQALLPRVASGEAICAFAITEPEAGSDVSGIKTTARRDGDDWILAGHKCFISNAGIADSYVLFARTSDDKHRGLSAFLLPGQIAGLRAVPTELVAAHPIGELFLDDVRLPGDALIGEVGDGFKLAMGTLDVFRPTVGAAAVGMAARARDAAVARVKSRQQFGRPLADFQATQLALAEMQTEIAAATLLVLQAAHKIDATQNAAPVESSMAKLFATEAAQRVIDRAVQLFGGAGLVRGAITERLYREIRALRIYEGTSEIQKLVIARAMLRS